MRQASLQKDVPKFLTMKEQNLAKKIAVLLMNLGGPDGVSAVEPFLFNLFSDKEIIKLPFSFLLQKIIARKIASSRAKKVIPRYEAIGGKSPINEITMAQATALQKLLNAGASDATYLVQPMMRYWQPTTEDAVDFAVQNDCSEIVAVSLYPHYCSATTGSSINELASALKKKKVKIPVRYAKSFAEHVGYIKALSLRIADGLKKFPRGSDPHILFSAHSIPEELVKKGDPYVAEVQNTISAVTKQIVGAKYTLAFQSRSGPVKWVGPATDVTIERLAKEGVKDMLIVPISFVSDHIETLYEIDIMFKEQALNAGVKNFIRAESLNAAPDFIEVLKDLALNAK